MFAPVRTNINKQIKKNQVKPIVPLLSYDKGRIEYYQQSNASFFVLILMCATSHSVALYLDSLHLNHRWIITIKSFHNPNSQP